MRKRTFVLLAGRLGFGLVVGGGGSLALYAREYGLRPSALTTTMFWGFLFLGVLFGVIFGGAFARTLWDDLDPPE